VRTVIVILIAFNDKVLSTMTFNCKTAMCIVYIFGFRALETGVLDEEEKISTDKLASLFDEVKKKRKQRLEDVEKSTLVQMDML